MAKLNRSIKLGALMSASYFIVSCTSGGDGAVNSSVTNLSGGVSKVLSSLSSGAPHVVTSGPVTADLQFNKWQTILQHIIPRATASAIGLSTIWDPTPGSPIAGANLAVINTYMGGFPATCDGATPSMCTADSGATHFPMLIPVKAWIGQAMDPNFKNSNGGYVTAFGRLRDAMKITCALGTLIITRDTDGLPPAGSYSISFPADTNNVLYKDFSLGGCGLDPSGISGNSTTATVTAPNGSVFTKKIVIPVGSFNSNIYLKLDLANGSMNFMSLEDTASSGNRNKVSRSIVKISSMNDSSKTKTMYEFSSMGYNSTRNSSTNCWDSVASQWNCDFEMHRAYIDNASNVAYLLSHNGNPGDNSGGTGTPTMYKEYLAAGKPIEIGNCTSAGCSQTIALSIGLAGQRLASGGSTSTTSDYNACVNVVSRAITSDNTVACDLTGTTVSVGSATIESSRVFYGATTASVPNVVGLTNENTDLSFTSGSDIYTAATAH